MAAPIRKFEELSPRLQARLIELLECYYTFKGHPNPKERAKNFIRTKQPKSRRQWQTIVFITMTKIDRQRNKAGLSALYFPQGAFKK